MNAANLVHHVENFQRRVVQDAVAEAVAATWRRRADAFEDARPRAEDFHGRASRTDLRERDARLAAVATACRRRATVALSAGQVPDA